ncbi:MAG: hypothetical protein WA888_02265 [Burkholderiaceae bacterium]
MFSEGVDHPPALTIAHLPPAADRKSAHRDKAGHGSTFVTLPSGQAMDTALNAARQLNPYQECFTAMWQVLLFISTALIGLFAIRALRRIAIVNRARAEFTETISLIHTWSGRRNDLALTAKALARLAVHKQYLDSAEQARQSTGKSPDQVAWHEAEFFLEYGRCDARHRGLLSLTYPDNDMYEQAMEVEQAISSLQAIHSRSSPDNR